MRRIFPILTLICSLSAYQSVKAQDDLDSLLNTLEKPARQYASATFKGTRVINLQSVEKIAPGSLQFLIQHRFGPVNGGGYQLFGLDQSTIRFGLEYGISKLLAVGVGRSSYEKNYDAYAKVSLLRQSTGAGAFPFSVAYFGSAVVNTLKWSDTTIHNYFSSRLSYTHQLIIARKMSERFSFELVPMVIHKNMVKGATDPNDSYALGAGGRLKLSKRTSLNAEYIYRVPPKDKTAPVYANFYNSFSVGFDIETGGHVFQLHLTNSLPMIEKGFITETTESWSKGGIHLGFNISRDFTFKKTKPRKQ